MDSRARDVEVYEGRAVKPEDNGFRRADDPRNHENIFPGLARKPLRAKRVKCDTASLCTKWDYNA